jgi:hypothetical protein
MHYRLRKDLSCCDVDGHLIFLDIAQDRYFMLTGALETAMRRFLAYEDVTPTLRENPASAQMLVEDPSQKAPAAVENIQRPTCSAIEQPETIADQRFSIAVVFEVMAIVWSTRHQLKTNSFKTNLDKARAYCDKKIDAHRDVAPPTTEGKLLQANGEFARARRYVPIEPTCLLDSLSLLRFLSRRGIPAHVIFGVAPEPFAAHCWVQAGDMVLNETLSDANAHTPIRKV